jgi:hypothetical protein
MSIAQYSPSVPVEAAPSTGATMPIPLNATVLMPPLMSVATLTPPALAMRRSGPVWRAVRWVSALSLMATASVVFAQQADSPAGTAANAAVASTAVPALAATPLPDAEYTKQFAEFDAHERALNARTTQMNYHYGVAQHDCYARFLVNSCLDDARDAMRTEKAEIRTEQLDLSERRRDLRARQRDQKAAASEQQTVADAPQRAATEQRNRAAFDAKQRQHELDMAKRGQDAGQRAANLDNYNRKQAAHQAALDQAKADAATDAQKRTLSVQRYQQKQQEAAERQRALLQRQQDAKDRAANQAQQPKTGSAL